jgi:hypothetical protein
MFIFESANKEMRADTDACYEAVASQEESYLEKTEEDLRMILEADDPHPSPVAGSDQQRESAVEELITGDSDDPPLSEESVAEMHRPPV